MSMELPTGLFKIIGSPSIEKTEKYRKVFSELILIKSLAGLGYRMMS